MFVRLWILSCVVFCLGFLCTLAGAVLKFLAGRNAQYTGLVQAKVVDIVTQPREKAASLSEFRNNQVAVFEFFADGRLIKVNDTADTYPCPYHMHESVTLRYDPASPEQFCVVARDRKQLLADALSICGVALILGGCGLFLFYASGAWR